MEQMSLFDNRVTNSPLASRLRPETLREYVGQKHLLGEGKVLRRLIEQDQISSMIFWGPPGVGKTTLARIIAGMTRSDFVDFSYQRYQGDPPGHGTCRRQPQDGNQYASFRR